MGLETGSHIPLGIGCTFIFAIAMPVSASDGFPPFTLLKAKLTLTGL